MNVSQGAAAVYSGNSFRDMVAAIGELSLGVMPRRGLPIGRLNQFGEPIKVGIFFPVRFAGCEDGLYVECQRQESSGSAEQKIDSKCVSITRYYDKPTILVVDGAGSSRIARAANHYIGEGPLLRVESFYGFWRFCNEIKETGTIESLSPPTLF